MAANIGGLSYLTLANESIWGTNPASVSGSDESGSGSADYWHLPVLNFTPKAAPQNRQSDPFIGLLSKKHSTNDRNIPGGQIVTNLYGWRGDNLMKSLAQEVIEWALNSQESAEPLSKSAVWAVGPNSANRTLNGLRVNSFAMAGSQDAGNIQVTLDVIGSEEQSIDAAPALPTNRYKATEFSFFDSVFAIDGTTQTVQSFNLSVQRALEVHHLNSYWPNLVLATGFVVQLQLVIQTEDDVWDGYVRNDETVDTEFSIVQTHKGLHKGTGASGTHDQIALTTARSHLLNVSPNGGRGVQFQTLNFVCLKPDNSNAVIQQAWTEN